MIALGYPKTVMFASKQQILRKNLKKLASSQNKKRHLILTLHGCRSHTSTHLPMKKGRNFLYRVDDGADPSLYCVGTVATFYTHRSRCGDFAGEC